MGDQCKMGEVVTSFIYFAPIVSDDGLKVEVLSRFAKATEALTNLLNNLEK